jgi:hypothetical protein
VCTVQVCQDGSLFPSTLTDVMTERPCELLHMDLVGLAHVQSVDEKWYLLVMVDDYSQYA